MTDATDIVLMAYADEPCRICGQLMTLNDVKAGAIWVGYSADGKSRTAHRQCWDGFVTVLRQLDASGDLQRILQDTSTKVRP